MAVVTTYATLQTAIGDYLARSDLTSFLPNFTQNWEEDFVRDPQNYGPWMEADLASTVGSSVAPVPADFMALKVAYFSTYRPLKRVSMEQLYERYPRANVGGPPQYVARNGANFEFGPNGAAGVLLGTYYAKPVALRTTDNFLVTDTPDLALYGSLLAAEPFIKNDTRIPVWQTFYDRQLLSYRLRMREEDYSGSAPFTVAV
jgi:hypothetical protein